MNDERRLRPKLESLKNNLTQIMQDTQPCATTRPMIGSARARSKLHNNKIKPSLKNRSIFHTRIPHSSLVQAYIGSDGTDVTASRLSMVEETGVPGENHRQQWVKTKNTTDSFVHYITQTHSL